MKIHNKFSHPITALKPNSKAAYSVMDVNAQHQ